MGVEAGRVLWFDVKKGYGFIRRSSGSDVFVHYSKIIAEPGEFRVLCENDEVEFEVSLADRGDGEQRPQAKNVRVVGGEDETRSRQMGQDRGSADGSGEAPQSSRR